MFKLVVVNRVPNLSGLGWVANQGFGSGFIGFHGFTNYQVFRFEKITQIHQFFIIIWSKSLDLVYVVLHLQKNVQISMKMTTLEYIFGKKVN